MDSVRRDLAAELQAYGAMLAAIEGQHDAILTQSSAAVSRSVSNVNAQVQRTNDICAQRQHSQEALARSLNQPADAPFATLIPLVAPKYRPALAALVKENNELRARIQRRARQNQMLLAKSLEMMQGLASQWSGGSSIPAAPC